jgi:hypothetical protein
MLRLLLVSYQPPTRELGSHGKIARVLTQKLHLSQHSQGNKQAEDEANKDADAKIKEIQSAGKKGQSKVVTDLLKAVLESKPVAPSKA